MKIEDYNEMQMLAHLERIAEVIGNNNWEHLIEKVFSEKSERIKKLESAISSIRREVNNV